MEPRNDSLNEQFVFYARVLTGDYTEGHGQQRLVAPPPKVSSSDMAVLYDSVVDDLKSPRRYVVFSNDQSYPDYLIKYASKMINFRALRNAKVTRRNTKLT